MNIRKFIFVSVFSLAVLTLAACSSDDGDEDGSQDVIDRGPTPTPIVTSANGITTVIVNLASDQKDGQFGTAKFVSDSETTTVEIAVEPPRGEAQPIHIHTGVCDDVGSVLHALENVIRGTSVTIINSPLSEIVAHGVLVNVHASYTDAGTYTACGQLPDAVP